MDSKFSYASPEENEKRRALEYMALSPTEKYYALMKLIQINYEIRQSNKYLKTPAK